MKIKNLDNKIKDLIIQKITGLSKEQLFLINKIPEEYKSEIESALKRLEKWEPIEYIINNAEFYLLDFYVDNRVLIPRNDTEVMVDEVLKEMKSEKYTLIDVWTWSSCIPISVLKGIPPTPFNKGGVGKCYVVDISEEALEVSNINIKNHNLEDKIVQIKWDLLDNFITDTIKLSKNVIITANLPYIKDADYENMDSSVIKYEPKLALYGWKWTWFEMYQELISQCLELKKKHNITLFIEIGFDQKEVAEEYLGKLGLRYEIFKDNGWVERCVKVYI